MKAFANENGSAMIISLLVLLMLGVIGIAAVQTSNTEMDIAENYHTGVKSFYVAEAGAELAFAVLRDTVTWRKGFAGYPFAKGTFDVRIVDNTVNSALAETLMILSTGRRAEAVTNLEVKLAPQRPFKWAVLGDEWIKACGGTSSDSYNSDSGSYWATRLKTGGDLGSNGGVDICGTSDIYGNVSTSSPGDMNIQNGAMITGDTTTVAPEMHYPPVPQSDIDNAIANNAASTGIKGDYKYDPATHEMDVQPGKTVTLSSGVYYFSELKINGDLELEPGASVKIYLTGDLEIQSGSGVNTKGAPKDFLIFSTGDNIKFTGQSEIRVALYAPEAEFSLGGGGDLYGAFIAKSVKDVGGSSFHYDRALAEVMPSAIYHRVSWREV